MRLSIRHLPSATMAVVWFDLSNRKQNGSETVQRILWASILILLLSGLTPDHARSDQSLSGYEGVPVQPLADQVRSAGCALAAETSKYRAQHLSVDALKASPKPPAVSESDEVGQAFAVMLATIGNAPETQESEAQAFLDWPVVKLRRAVDKLKGARENERWAFTALGKAVPGDGSIGASITALARAEIDANDAAQIAQRSIGDQGETCVAR